MPDLPPLKNYPRSTFSQASILDSCLVAETQISMAANVGALLEESFGLNAEVGH